MIKINTLLIIGLIIFTVAILWLAIGLNNATSTKIPTYSTLTTQELEQAYKSGALKFENPGEYSLFDYTRGHQCNPETATCRNEANN